MSKQETPLDFMLGMTHEEFEHWVWCGEHSEDNVVDLHKEALRLREEVEKWKALAEAKVVFASNGNNEYQYELQEDNIRLRKELEEKDNQRKTLLRTMQKVHYDLRTRRFHGAGASVDTAIDLIDKWLAENKPVGQEGEGNQDEKA